MIGLIDKIIIELNSNLLKSVLLSWLMLEFYYIFVEIFAN